MVGRLTPCKSETQREVAQSTAHEGKHQFRTEEGGVGSGVNGHIRQGKALGKMLFAGGGGGGIV